MKRVATPLLAHVASTLLGLGGFFVLWTLAAHLAAEGARSASFAGFGPGPALTSLLHMAQNGEIWRAAAPSLARLGSGLAIAALIGIPAGVAVGHWRWLNVATHAPFQFLRMISPLAWTPFAVLMFPTWDGAIVFLIAMAAVWPILFATAAGLSRLDPQWFKVTKNLGANWRQLLTTVILPATAGDIFTGLRLALGVGWIVLAPAEFLGVTSGLGYAINDARDTLAYDRLTAAVLIIGAIGLLLDSVCVALLRRFSWRRG